MLQISSRLSRALVHRAPWGTHVQQTPIPPGHFSTINSGSTFVSMRTIRCTLFAMRWHKIPKSSFIPAQGVRSVSGDQNTGQSTDEIGPYLKLAENGNVKAMLVVGIHYRQEGRDPVKALHWLKKAAEHGGTEAMIAIGIMYIDKNDTSEAFKWFKKAAEQGDVKAMTATARVYAHREDYSKAAEWAAKAVDRGDLGAMGILGGLLLDGNGVAKDVKRAVELLLKATVSGDSIIMFHLGRAYLFEDEVLNQDEAMKWMSRSAELGCGPAMVVVAKLYCNPNTARFDAKKAVYWCEKAADKDLVPAMLMLYQLHRSGSVSGIAKDYSKAMLWLTKAADTGDGEANYLLGLEYFRGPPHDRAKAMSLFTKAAEAGDVHAMMGLAQIYHHGIWVMGCSEEVRQTIQAAAAGDAKAMETLDAWRTDDTEHDMKRAVEWYTKAADNGSVDSMINLGVIYEHGSGVPQDHEKAAEWYGKAADAGDPYGQSRREDYNSSIGAVRVHLPPTMAMTHNKSSAPSLAGHS